MSFTLTLLCEARTVVRAETFRASDDCAEIVGVGYAVEYDQKKVLALVFCKVQNIFDVAIRKVGDRRDYALVVAAVCEFVEHIFVNVTHDSTRFFCKFENA